MKMIRIASNPSIPHFTDCRCCFWVFNRDSLLSNRYTPDNILFRDINFGIDLQSRIGILGRNGVGKSTLIKVFSM